MIKKIESVNNSFIKDLLKLHQKKYRDLNKKFLIEGYHLVNEAKKRGLLEQALITKENDLIGEVENFLVNNQIIEKLSFTKTPQSIIGVCKYFDDYKIKGKRFLLLDEIQDPGNLGTLVRSSLGFDIDLVIVSSSTVDIYNDKFLRSTQGTIFSIPVIKGDLLEIVNNFKKNKIKVIGTSVTSGIPLSQIPKLDSYAILLGNEGNGVKEELLKNTDYNVFIETNSNLESLNVAVAGSIIMYNMLHK